MIVKVKILGSIIPVNVGDGQQSFKWLGSVVQSRLKQSKVLRNNYANESYIVTEIRNASGELLNPVDCIFEHAGPNGLEVTATISNSYPTDEWENPIMGDWLKGAYIHSDIGKQWFSESEAWRDSLSAIQEHNKDAGIAGSQRNQNILNQHNQQQSTSSLIKIGFDFTESDINAAFDLDWSTMKWSFLPKSVTDNQRNAIGDTLKSNYSVICNMFAHYCGIGQVGQRYGLTMNDFAHLMHFLKIYNIKTEMKESEDAYFKTTAQVATPALSTRPTATGGGGGGTNTKWPLMTRANLSQALVYVAMKEQTGDVVIAVRNLIETDGPLDCLWTEVISKYLYHTCEEADLLKKTTMEYYQLLKQAFETRSYIDPKYGPKLSVSAFIDMLVESTMIEPEHESVCVKSFLQAHFNPTPEWEINDMVLCEFIEALSLVSVKIIESTSGLSDAKKIRMAFNFMTELAPINNSSGSYGHK